MRHFTNFLIFALWIIFLAVSTAHAMDALLGEIVSVDPEHRQLVVSVKDGEEAAGTRQVIVSYDRSQLPTYVRPGAMVRLWGEYISENSSEFKVQSLHNGECLDGNDPTGVRSRLKQRHGHHGMGMGKNQGGRCP